MLKTNRTQLVRLSVEGKIVSPGKVQDYITGIDGVGLILPATGGIAYNVRIGRNCMDLAGDHIEPGVTTANFNTPAEQKAYSMYTCIGNTARVLSGEALGACGVVTGKHDNSNVMIDFPEAVLKKLGINDRIVVEAYGQGLKLLDYPEITLMNLDPDLLDNLPLKLENDFLEIEVAHRIPACLIGSGIGTSNCYQGDVDIMTQDRAYIEELGLNELRFGDLVLLEDIDSMFGRTFMRGSWTVGVIIHGDCYRPGHGPGVTTLLCGRTSSIRCTVNPRANLANFSPFREMF